MTFHNGQRYSAQCSRQKGPMVVLIRQKLRTSSLLYHAMPGWDALAGYSFSKTISQW